MSPDENRLEHHRAFFARLIAANAGIPPDSELAAAFASLPREKFVGPPPWKIFTRAGYIDTPTSDPAFLYQDVVVSLGVEEPLNNGQPTLHAFCIAALAVQKGEHVVHIGAGTGYYTAILARLVGETGSVEAYEIHPQLSQRSRENLAELRQVTVHARSGTEGPFPSCDVVYVNAGATEPMAVWLDALRPNGRLLFPLSPENGVGAMLLVTRREDSSYSARFLSQVQFIPCIGAQNEPMSKKLTEAFQGRDWMRVKSLHRNNKPDDNCWCAGEGWWLSLA
jgi:protein-L-isoaspartate(D-aspartate) O-methyltransferase